MKSSLLKVALATALTGMAATAAYASEGNPYLPQANGHSYRHGAVPTRELNEKAKAWENAHATRFAAPTASTGVLSYGGGVSGVGVMSGQTKVYLVFYGTQWGTQSGPDANGNYSFSGDPNGAAAVVQKMFKGIGTNSELWSADLTQWCDGTGVSSGATSCPASGASYVPYQQNIFAGLWYDNSAASPASATAAQLGEEANKAAAHFGNTTSASNRYTYYVILSPHGTNPDNYQSPTNGYCAWHDYNTDAGATQPYGLLAFSNQPYNIDVGTSCGTNFVNSGTAGMTDGYTMTLGHEWHEMVSDQFPAGGWTNHTGGTYNGQENSDECAWISPGTTGGAANIAFSTGTFAEQASWSNDTGNCAISHPIVSHGGPTANFTFTTSVLTANFTDTSTDSGGTITGHSWTFGDGSTSTATSPSHTYAASGTYSVTETVTDSNSKTASKTSSVSVSNGAGTPTASFSFTTNGLTANFTDTSTDSGGTLGTHSWNFGDSSTSTAASPSHTYAAAGTYTVTETVADSVNTSATSTATHSVTVSTGNVLQNGVGVTISDATTGHQQNWTMAVPAGATNLVFTLSPGTSGDADMYVKFGSAPTLTSYDCRPYLGGTSTESCPITTAQTGTYYVMVNAYSAYSGFTLKGSYTAPGTGGTPTANFTFTTSGLTANFTDTSTDAGGTLSAHSWTFGDGASSSATSPSHTYAASGSYNVTETVTDSVNGHTSSKTSSVSVSGGGCTATQLLVNGNFDTGAATPWSMTSGVLSATSSQEPSHSGSYEAWMDGYGSAHTDTVSQAVTVPACATTGTVSFWLHIDTAETGSTAYDKLTVTLGSATLATFSNVNAAAGYVQHTYNVNVTGGSSLTLKFNGVEDTSLQTSFVLDDVSFTVQ
jgi:serine protease